MDKIIKLLRRPKPIADESKNGYVIRLGEYNGYVKPSWILKLLESPSQDFRGGPLNHPFSIGRLSAMVSIDRSALLALEHKKMHTKVETFGHTIPSYMVRLSRPKFCPTCLSQDNYFRRIWDLAPVTSCPIHKILLYDYCPNCLSSLTWARACVSECRCGCDWRNALGLRVHDNYLALSMYIYELCGLLPKGITKRKQANPLYALNLTDLLTVVFFVAGQLKGLTDTTGKTLASASKNIDLHYSLSAAIDVFENWPTNFYNFLDEIRNHSCDSKHSTGLNKDFGTLHSHLGKTFSRRQFNFMGEAYENFLTERWDGGYVSNRCKSLSRNLVHKNLMTKNQVQATLRVKERTIDRLLKAGVLTGTVRKMKTREMFLIDRNSVFELKRDRAKYVDVKTAIAYLGLSKRLIYELVREKFLTPLTEPLMHGSVKSLFMKESLQSFLKTIEERMQKKDGHRNLRVIELHEVLQKMSRYKFGLTDLLRAICGGQIRPCAKVGRGLRGFRFYDDDIIAILRQKKTEERGNMLSGIEAAKMLGVKEEEFYFLRKKFFSCGQDTTKNSSYIDIEGLNVFKETYISLAEISRKNNTSSKCLVNILIAKGIVPITGPKIDGGRQYFFKRRDIRSKLIKLQLSKTGMNHLKKKHFKKKHSSTWTTR